MNPFIEKLKNLILNDISKRSLGEPLVEEHTFAELQRGTYGTAASREGTYRPTPTTAQRNVAIDVRKLLSDHNDSNDDAVKADSDTGVWSTELSKRKFNKLNDKLGREVTMWLDDNTAMFLNNLFGKLFDTDKVGNDLIKDIKVKFDSRTNTNYKKRLDRMINLSAAHEFLANHNKLINFLSEDIRFAPRYYTIEIDVPVDKYDDAELEKICLNLDTNLTAIGITGDDISKTLKIVITVTSFCSLVNLYSSDINSKFSVATNSNALLKFCWMTDQIKKIFQSNTGDPNKKFMSARRLPGIQYSPVDILGSAWSDANNRLVQDSVYFFIDHQNGSFVYIPADGRNSEKLMSIPPVTEVKTWWDKIYDTINKYVDGVISIDVLTKLLTRYFNMDETSGDVEISELNSTIGDLVYNFTAIQTNFSKDVIINKATKLRADVEKEISHIMDLSDSSNSITIPYDTFLHTLDTAITVFRAEDKDSPNFNEAIDSIKNQLKTLFETTNTDIDDLKRLLRLLRSRGKTFKVFRFMYENRVDMDYSIDVPTDVASKILDTDSIDETQGIKVSCSIRSGENGWLNKIGVEKLKKDLSDNNITEDPKKWLSVHYVCPECLNSASLDDTTRNILADIHPYVSKDIILQSVELKTSDNKDGVVVPGTQNFANTTTNLVRKIEIDPASSNKLLKYVLTTNVKNVASQPSGSLYGIKYDGVPQEVQHLSVADTITNIIGLRSTLGEIIDAFYFMPTESQIEELQSGGSVFDDIGNEYSNSDNNVKYALANIDSKSDPTLILRSRPKKYIEDGQTIFQFGEEKIMFNITLLDQVFSDFYDGMVYMRNQLEKIMDKNGIKISDTGKNANQLRKSGRPAVVNVAARDIVNDIRGGQNHGLMFNMQLSKLLGVDMLRSKILAYLKYKKEKLLESVTEKDKDRFTTTVIEVTKDDPPIESINFSGDRLFVKNERNAWLNGTESPLIPFLDAYKNENLSDGIKEKFQKLAAKGKEIEVLKYYYAHICDLCGYVNNFNKLMISDGHRARQFDKKSQNIVPAIHSKIETGIPYVFVTENHVGKREINFNTAKKNAIIGAPASQINSGFIVDDLVNKEFRPIVYEVAAAIRSLADLKKNINGGVSNTSLNNPPIGMTPNESEIPKCPYHTVVFATVEKENIVIHILSSCAAVKPDDGRENDFVYDEDGKYVSFIGDNRTVDPEIMALAAKKVAMADLGYNAVFMVKQNYFSNFINDLIDKMVSNSASFFWELRNLIMSYFSNHADLANIYVNCVRDISSSDSRQEHEEEMSRLSDDIFSMIKNNTAIDFDKNIENVYKLFLILSILEND